VDQVPPPCSLVNIEQAVEELTAAGYTLTYRLAFDVEAEQTSLVLLNDNDRELQEREQAVLIDCVAQENWVADRSRTPDAWATFERTTFTTKVKNSFEHKYCEASANDFDFEAFTTEFNEKIKAIQTRMQENALTLDKVPSNVFSQLNLNANEQAIVASQLLERMHATNEYSEEEIALKILETSMSIAPDDIEIALQIIRLPNAIKWLDKVNFTKVNNKYLLLNTASSIANFGLYKALKTSLDIEKSHFLDPFYFFVKGYDPFHISFSFRPSSERENEEFIQYFRNAGYTVNEHHARLAFFNSIIRPENHKLLQATFPELIASQSEDYFGVECRALQM